MSAALPVTPAVRERPILFSGPMVKAILAGAKTQTRRVLTPQPPTAEAVCAKSGSGFHLFTDRSTPGEYRVAGPVWAVRDLMDGLGGGHGPRWRCPYGAPGDRLWVRETWGYVQGAGVRVVYRADGVPTDRFRGTPIDGMKWIPSIHMFRRDSRLTLEITDVRVQRLQEISEEDARAEGVEPFFARFPSAGRDQRLTSGELAVDAEHRASFAVLWDEINLARDYRARHDPSWKANPWVWALSFRRVA